MTLTVVTITCRDPGGLAETAASINAQLVPPAEWIVVDGGTPGFVAPPCRHVETRMVVISEPDRGIYDAMAKGLSQATGKMLIFLNGGDVFVDEDVLTRVLTAVSAEELTVHCFATRLRTAGGGSWRRLARGHGYVRHGMPAIQQSTVYPTKALRDTFPVPATFPTCGDYWINAALWQAGYRFAAHPEMLAEFRYGGVSSARPLRLITEAWRVQRDVLNMPTVWRCGSALIRGAAFIRQRTRMLPLWCLGLLR